MNTSSCAKNADKIIKKVRKRLFFLRMLKSYNANINVMINFCHAVIKKKKKKKTLFQ